MSNWNWFISDNRHLIRFYFYNKHFCSAKISWEMLSSLILDVEFVAVCNHLDCIILELINLN